MTTTYTVLSDNCIAGGKGTTVTGKQLDGCNVVALIAGGHLSVSAPKPDPEVPTAIPATETKEQ